MRITAMERVHLDNLVDNLGVGRLLQAILEICQEQEAWAREDQDPIAHAWGGWARELERVPGVLPHTPTLPLPAPARRRRR